MKKNEDLKILYIVLAHNNPKQLKKLVESLSYKNNTFLIHFDLNGSKEDFIQVEDFSKANDNVYLVDRQRCYWGDMSLINATIESLKFSFKNSIIFNYAVLISGQHYPIKSNEYIEEFLNKSEGINYINHFMLPTPKWGSKTGGLDRVMFYHFNKHFKKKYSIKRFFNRALTFALKSLNIKRATPNEIDQFYGGSQWWCLTYDSCKYVLQYISENPKTLKYFKYVLIPDEIFFQTILLNSKCEMKITNDNLTYIDWGDNTTSSPFILKESDFVFLRSSHNLWARKFDDVESSKLLSLLDKS
jgi:hypothetical protein